MRLFVAIDIDEQTRAQLASARNAIEPVINAARVPPRVTWVHPEVAHVTLQFIGEVSEEITARIQLALAQLTFPGFDVTWSAVGTFGGRRHPRVLWLGATSGEELLVRLASDVRSRLKGILGPGDARQFAPHLTLARVRTPGKGVDWARALEVVHFVPTVTRIAHVILYQSHLSPKGPTYTAVSTHG